MYKGNRSRLFPIIVVLVVMAIAIFALVTLGRWVFSSLNGTQNAQPETSQQASIENTLLNNNANSSVRMTVRGPIVGDEQFRSYQITISPTSRSIITWSGYDQANVIDQKTLDNDKKAYDEFVYAINYAGYTKSAVVKDNNTKGLCASGRVYHFEVLSDSTTSQDTWTTNCNSKQGSFRGNGPVIRELFLKQIEGSSQIVGNVDL